MPDILHNAKGISSQRPLLFRPWIVIVCSLVGASIYAWCITKSPWAGSGRFNLSGSSFYDVSIVLPIVAFLFDRVERRSELKLFHFAIDLIVVGSAVGRVVGNVPFVSGHTLFLTYAIISTRSLVVRIPAIILLTQAVYLKYFVWHDLVTSTDGIILGAISGLLVLKFGKTNHSGTRVESNA